MDSNRTCKVSPLERAAARLGISLAALHALIDLSVVWTVDLDGMLLLPESEIERLEKIRAELAPSPRS